ncbi:hypothetical protein COY62_02040, partial [bacterium (Candidatus Howlettbacteria) CG_4_10_14_0_8_um_filter_40_9]
MLDQISINLIINGLSLFVLVLTLYFMSKTMELYGGRVGKSLNYVGLGIFVLSLREILVFVNNIFDYDIVLELTQSSTIFIYSAWLSKLLVFS